MIHDYYVVETLYYILKHLNNHKALNVKTQTIKLSKL
jgi:hypothetical protein